MYYEINVAKNGKHFFATDSRSIRDERKCKEVYDELRAAFPKDQGYEVTVTMNVISSRAVTTLGNLIID